MQKLKLKDRSGFTIIEIMIVLAIAGLIMLIVFLAVPALQRSARNTSRKNDVGNISTAIANYISNNNGTPPGMESGAFNQTTCNNDIYDSTGPSGIVTTIKLGYYTDAQVYCAQPGSAITNCSSVGTSSCTASSTEVTTENVIYIPGDTCSGNSPTSGAGRGFALVYEVESGSSSAQEQCLAG